MSEPKAVLYRNWVKAGLAFLYTKEGIQGFIEAFIDQYARDIYTDALQQHGHLPGTVCSSCTIQNVLQCRTQGICTGKHCDFHNNSDPTKTNRPCPLNICGFIREKLIKTNRNKHGPSFLNTTAEYWCSSSWEIAKCFLQPTGYKDISTADDTDFTGLVTIIINHILFQGVLSENLSARNNIFSQVRGIRNKVVHSAKMEVHSKDLAVYFNVLIKLLSDSKRLVHLPEAQAAVQKLTQLQNDLISITTEDEERVKEESLRAIKEETNQSISLLQNERTDILTEFDNVAEKTMGAIGDKSNAVNAAVDAFQTTVQSAKQSIKTISDDGVVELKHMSQNLADDHKRKSDDLNTNTTDSIKLITDRIKAGLATIIDEVRLGVQTLKKQVDKSSRQRPVGVTDMSVNRDAVIDEVLSRLQNQHISKEVYIDEKNKLRLALINQYQRNFCTMPFSPLIQEEEIDVDKLFVMPSMRIVEHDLPKSYTGEFQYRYLKTYKDLFQKDSRQVGRVYMLSDAGRGKTTLCQMMLQTWCNAHSASEEIDLNPDEEFFKSFEFLFYLPLRIMTHLYHVTDMIKALLIRKKYHGLLDKVIHEDSDKCLILLDGLDEWSAPEEALSGKDKGHLPYIDPTEEFTIFTTSRPWKLEVLRLQSSKIDQEIQLIGLTERTAEFLVSKLLKILNHKFGKSKRSEPFMDELKKKNMLHLTGIPFILMQIVCLWHDGREYGSSQVEVYSNMINFIMELAKERFEDEELVPSKQVTDTILGSVAELAFKTLIRENAYSMIVFPRSVAKPFGIDISKDAITFCLRVGILSQSKHMLLATTRMKSLSFLHKTFHEFFAAKFISTGDDKEDDFFEKLSTITTIFEMERVLVFLSGLKPSVINKVIKHIADKTDADEMFHEYRHSASSRRYFKVEEGVMRAQNLVLECIGEGYKDDYNKADLVLRDITTVDFENKYTDKHMECLKVDGIRSIAVDYTEIPFLLPPILANNVNNIVKFNGYVGSQDQLDMMKTIIEHTQETIQCLGICSSRFAKPTLKDGLNLGNLFQPVDTLQNLGCIEFERIDLTHQRIQELMGFLNSKTNLHQIMICDITCTSCTIGECSYDLDLSQHAQLELISLTSLFANDVRLNPSKLVSCHIQSLHRPASIISILRSIRDSSCLTSFIFNKHISLHEKYQESVAVLTEVLPTLKRLEHLSLKAVAPGQSTLTLSHDMTEIEYVVLTHVTLNLQQFQDFVGSLPSTGNDMEVLFNDLCVTPSETIPRAIQIVMDDKRFNVLKNTSTDKMVNIRLKEASQLRED